MAYVLDQDKEKEQNGLLTGQEGQGVKSANDGPVTLGAGGGQIDGVNGSGQNVNNGNAQRGQSGTFTNLSNYLQQNASQASELGKRVAGAISEQGNNARNKIQEGQDQFNQKVEGNTVHLNQGLLDDAAKNTAQFAQDQDKLNQFVQQRDAEYIGPKTLQDTDYYSPAAQAVAEAKRQGDLTQTESGRTELLANLQQGKRFSRGALNLDQLLLQNDEAAKAQLEQARTGLSDLDQRLADAAKAAQDRATAAAQETAATKAAVNQRFLGDQGELNTFKTDLNSRTTSAQQQAQARADATLQALKNGASGLTAQQLSDLGISQDQYNQLIGDRNYLSSTFGRNDFNDLSKFATVNNPTASINVQNVASGDDYARLAALNQLLGIQDQTLYDPSQAGKANLDVLDFDFGNASGNIKNTITAEQTAKAQREAEERAAAERAEAERKAAETRATVGGAAVGFAVGGPVGGVIGGFVCFAENTPILMANGTYKNVQDVQLLDETFYGGKVTATGIALSDELYSYQGTLVTGSHAIYENNQWIRVRDSKFSTKLVLDGYVKVYPVCTEEHILITNNNVWADFAETDQGYGVNDAQRLEYLNNNKAKNERLALLAKALKEQINAA